MFPSQARIRRHEAGDEANLSLPFSQTQLAPHQSNRDQHQARKERGEMCRHPGTRMRQCGGGDPKPEADEEKAKSMANQPATLRLNQARHGHLLRSAIGHGFSGMSSALRRSLPTLTPVAGARTVPALKTSST
jgi:hypothetical protein